MSYQDAASVPVLLRNATARGRASFTELLSDVAPELLPRSAGSDVTLPHATTIVAATYADGVVLAGDRRATMGNLIAQRDIEKVFAADRHSAIGFAGVAGVGIQMIRLFQVELEHYEKIEGTPLTLDGKANRLATMIRGNLGAAMQGLVAIPLFAGYDLDVNEPAAAGKIYSYDVSGSLNQERYYHGVGSGSIFAKNSLKKLWSPGLERGEIVRVVIEALYDAADDDSATGGPDVQRRIYPVILTVTAAGVARVESAEQEPVVAAVIADRTGREGV